MGSQSALDLVSSRIAQGKPVFFDGGTGSMLIAQGLQMGRECPDEWNRSRPDAVAEIHRRYFAAGADFSNTNTFGGSRYKLEKYDLGECIVEFNRAAARICAGERTEDKFCAGNIGPTGELVAPLGVHTPEEFREVFAEQAAALAEGGADIINIETMIDLEEMRAAIQGARSVTDLPVFASMSFEPGQRGFRTMMGVDPETAVKTMEDEGADVVGANCSVTIEQMLPLVPELVRHATRPVMVQPNAGRPVMRDGVTHYEQTAEEFARYVPRLFGAGAAIVGGCCGTNPEFIAAAAASMA